MLLAGVERVDFNEKGKYTQLPEEGQTEKPRGADGFLTSGHSFF
jgi:hypothetical protein